VWFLVALKHPPPKRKKRKEIMKVYDFIGWHLRTDDNSFIHVFIEALSGRSMHRHMRTGFRELNDVSKNSRLSVSSGGCGGGL